MCVCRCACTCVLHTREHLQRPEVNFRESAFSFYQVGPRDQTHIVLVVIKQE